MPGTVIQTSMNGGYPGTYARNADCYIEAKEIKSTDVLGPSFGDPVIQNTDNTYSKFTGNGVATFAGTTGTMAAFAGVAVREIKQFITYVAAANGKYEPTQIADVIKRGNVMVVCNVGTPTLDQGVYVRVTANLGIAGSVVGGFEARTDTDNAKCILITNAKWNTGVIDANLVTELNILSRNL
jgi:hypothetical protein